ncbi:type II toxin-antitoxin system PemK/MazF family toxin [Curtobacterium sp. Leaf261]|uniref:type II toxin-antitoxin system PemK/MazF family toxin n=1 Tax=Curtobacterium sp. Leaf261 TaxID=1736311 RepID=UPI000AE086EC|nr:type II toxin-antitoxin system PemK/MazF family toxin [Curtobacterium sp. Leaf261]
MIRRGDVHWARLTQTDGLVKRRPVLVVQADRFNRSRIGSVLVVPLTSNTAAGEYPGNVFVPSSVSGLARDSVVTTPEVRSLQRHEVDERIAELPLSLVRDVDRGLRLVLGL